MINPTSLWIGVFVLLAIAVIVLFVRGCLRSDAPDDDMITLPEISIQSYSTDAESISKEIDRIMPELAASFRVPEYMLRGESNPIPKGWQPHAGDGMPVPVGTKVAVMFRDGEITMGVSAEEWDWRYNHDEPMDGDILAWRVA